MNEWVYIWDKASLTIHAKNLQELNKVTINEFNALELFRKKELVYDPGREATISLIDKFGEIIVRKEGVIEKRYRVAPWKLAPSHPNSEEVYDYIVKHVFDDIKDLLSLILIYTGRELRGFETFRHMVYRETPRSIDFFIYIIELLSERLGMILHDLFMQGPIHKKIMRITEYTGNQILLKSLVDLSPYKYYLKQIHAYETVLNKMLFQSIYFILVIASYLRDSLRGIGRRDIINRVDKVTNRCHVLLDTYHLWSFFSTESLNDDDLLSAISSQTNPYYRRVYEIFKIVREIAIFYPFITIIYFRRGYHIPVRDFHDIYETWAISKIVKSLRENGYSLISTKPDPIKNRSKKMYFIFMNDEGVEITVIWELRFEAIFDSTYYGSLIRRYPSIDSRIKIKPDITLVISENNSIKKVFIGDVKFVLGESGILQLPSLDILYKVLGYVYDLKKNKVFKTSNVEGILIYPGNISPVKIPDIKNENYINILPLNKESQLEKSIIQLI